MDKRNLDKSKELIGNLYSELALSNHNTFHNMVNWLLTHKRIPEDPWPSNLIEHLLHEISLMDSNNFINTSGVGEREGRVASEIVAKRHFYLSHGIGRSGDLFSVQPKAGGSSLISKLTCSMAKDAMNLLGVGKLNSLVLPLATGMSLTLCLLTLKQTRPSSQVVIWSRIDQKTCLKCITTAGLQVEVLEGRLEGEKIVTGDLLPVIERVGASNILCLLTTTSCFAPRVPDNIELVSVLCKEQGVPHVINNAYGLQCSKICHHIKESVRLGRVDFIVQSTDKNFLVPVGGAVVSSPNKELLEKLNQIYPGRASMSSVLDLFITFLTVGAKGLVRKVQERKQLAVVFKEKLSQLALSVGERVLDSKENTISFAVSCGKDDVGSKLFLRRVSGCRFVGNLEKEVCGIRFRNYGSSLSGYPFTYFTAACALGLTLSEVEVFLERLREVLK